MLQTIKIILLLVTWMFSTIAFADSTATPNIDANIPLVRSAAIKLIQRDAIPGMAVILYSGGEMHNYYFGEAVPANHTPVTENTIFELGSITKTFTGLLLAENIVINKMKLNNPAAEYLQIKRIRSFKRVTLLELATHTGSLPFNAPGLHYDVSDSERHQLQMYHFLQTWTAPFSPGSKMVYSNFGYGVLGDVLAESAVTSLSLLMEQNILQPLGMDSAGLDVDFDDQKNMAQGFNGNGQPTSYHVSGLLAGAWAMRASPRDMQAYLKAALMLPSTPDTIAQAMKIAQTPYYRLADRYGTMLGLGWEIIPLNQYTMHHLTHEARNTNAMTKPGYKILNPHFVADTLVYKTGTTDGFRAYIAVIPDKQTGIVILMNRCVYDRLDMLNMANKLLLQASGLVD